MTPEHDETITRDGPPIKVLAAKLDQAEQADTAKLHEHTLTDLAAEFEFFTTGVIYAATLFDRDAVAEFNWQYHAAPDEQPFMIESPQPFFSGLGEKLLCGCSVNFDHRIYGVAKARWPFLRDTIAGIVMYKREPEYYARLCFYSMPIIDQLKLQRTRIVTSLPMVMITVFAVDATDTFAFLQESQFPRLPYFVRGQPRGGLCISPDSRYGIPVPTQPPRQ